MFAWELGPTALYLHPHLLQEFHKSVSDLDGQIVSEMLELWMQKLSEQETFDRNGTLNVHFTVFFSI